MPHGNPIAGYVFPFESEGFESVPIKGLTKSTGSIGFPFNFWADTVLVQNKDRLKLHAIPHFRVFKIIYGKLN
ncbi:hypothetical protein D3C81_2234290 [compost metagenome]